MSEMKSAFERAMERAERLGRPSEEDMAQWHYQPEGEKLAVAYLRDGTDLAGALAKHDPAARKYMLRGAQDILLRNLSIPRHDHARQVNEKVVAALKSLKQNKAALGQVLSQMQRVFEHYEREGAQQRRQAYEQLKRDFEVRLQQMVQQQMGPGAGVRVQVESQPQFQDEWRRVQSMLDSQYEKLLDEYRSQIQSIS